MNVVPVQVKRATLVDSRNSVADIAFAPKHFGLLLVRLFCCLPFAWFRLLGDFLDHVNNLISWFLFCKWLFCFAREADGEAERERKILITVN